LITITGTDDHVRPEPVITFHRIERSSSTGTSDHFRPEHAAAQTHSYAAALSVLVVAE
jgi:hypothetical protein